MKASSAIPWLTFILLRPVAAQSTVSNYVGYNLTATGPAGNVIYDTASTMSNVTVYGPPDVYLNASVHVGEIDLLVKNLTADINLSARVLQLLDFNAGVQASVNKVELLIQNVDARVELEARLGNLVSMIDSILESIDLNPIIATLGNGLDQITNATTGLINSTTGAASTLLERSVLDDPKLENNILYSVNDYQGNSHRNRILAQNGDIEDKFLDNQGVLQSRVVVGNYARDMTATGKNVTINNEDGSVEYALEYEYHPMPGLCATCEIFVDSTGSVKRTKIISEVEGGGDSTVI